MILYLLDILTGGEQCLCPLGYPINIISYLSIFIIFIGYPNWWGTMPMPVFTFFEEYNLSGKVIIPFCTHEGSGLSRSVKDIEKLNPNSEVFPALAIRGGSVKTPSSRKSVETWLKDNNIL